MQAAGEQENARYAELNREFHMTVYEYAHSPLLMWASLNGGPRVMRTHADSVRQHVAIPRSTASWRRSTAAHGGSAIPAPCPPPPPA
jgi:hypothetical protein